VYVYLILANLPGGYYYCRGYHYSACQSILLHWRINFSLLFINANQCTWIFHMFTAHPSNLIIFYLADTTALTRACINVAPSGDAVTYMNSCDVTHTNLLVTHVDTYTCYCDSDNCNFAAKTTISFSALLLIIVNFL